MNVNERQNFGALLRSYRTRAGLTQEELAERAGLSRRGIADLERGARRAPHADTVQRLGAALELSAAESSLLNQSSRPRIVEADQTEREAGQDQAARRTDEGMLGVAGGVGPHAVAGRVRSLAVFLIAELRGYGRYTREQGDDSAAALAIAFASLTRDVAEAHAGEVAQLRGDRTVSIFGSARHALRAAEELRAHRRAGMRLSLPLAIGLDAGEPVPVGDSFLGDAVEVASALAAQAGPGEVLASDLVIRLARPLGYGTLRRAPNAHAYSSGPQSTDWLPAQMVDTSPPSARMGTSLSGMPQAVNAYLR